MINQLAIHATWRHNFLHTLYDRGGLSMRTWRELSWRRDLGNLYFLRVCLRSPTWRLTWGRANPPWLYDVTKHVILFDHVTGGRHHNMTSLITCLASCFQEIIKCHFIGMNCYVFPGTTLLACCQVLWQVLRHGCFTNCSVVYDEHHIIVPCYSLPFFTSDEKIML